VSATPAAPNCDDISANDMGSPHAASAPASLRATDDARAAEFVRKKQKLIVEMQHQRR